jgi:hypothetical protein
MVANRDRDQILLSLCDSCYAVLVMTCNSDDMQVFGCQRSMEEVLLWK